MKFRIMSDLHLEFENTGKELFPIPYIGEDYLILAGDIQVSVKKKKWFLRLLKERNVIYIAGNHEFYDQDCHEMRKKLNYFAILNETAAKKGYRGRLTVLDNHSFEVGIIGERETKVKIIGSTLWSDVDPAYHMKIQQEMSDYRVIRNGDSVLTPAATIAEHKKNVEFLAKEIAEKPLGHKTLVITHHAPSFRSVPEQFKNSELNSAYASNLEYLMKDVDLWVHGHMHNSSDYEIDGCRVVCNPRGYFRHEVNPDFDIDFMVEL